MVLTAAATLLATFATADKGSPRAAASPAACVDDACMCTHNMQYVHTVQEHLDDEHAASQATWPHNAWMGHCTVVCNEDYLHGKASCPCTFCSDAKVEAIACVVVDEEEASRGTGDGVDGGEDGLHGGGGKDLTRGRGCEHACADKASVHGLVARPAPRDHGNVARVVKIGVNDDLDLCRW